MDCDDNLDARAHLEKAKEDLHTHFRTTYDKPLPVPTASVASMSTINSSPQKVNFMSRYRNLPQAFTDQVQEYFRLPQENFNACDPLQWWASHNSQFSNLSCFARDIFSIPGEFTSNNISFFLNLFMQDRLSLLNGFFWKAAIQFLYAMQDSIQRLLECLWWSNSSFSLLALPVMTFSDIGKGWCKVSVVTLTID